jgi:hypothetical protein
MLNEKFLRLSDPVQIPDLREYLSASQISETLINALTFAEQVVDAIFDAEDAVMPYLVETLRAGEARYMALVAAAEANSDAIAEFALFRDENEPAVDSNAHAIAVALFETIALKRSKGGEVLLNTKNLARLASRMWRERAILVSRSGAIAPRLVTAAEIAKKVHLREKSIDPYRKEWPEPSIKIGGSRPHQWSTFEILPVLKKQFAHDPDIDFSDWET